jgi:hypothetical protein
MNISGASMSDGLASMASSMQASNLGLQFSTAVMKKVMDTQKMQGDALVAMINQTPTASLNGIGSIIDVQA